MKGNPFADKPETLGNGEREAKVRQLLDWIWQEHGTKSAVTLSDETHAVGTPWRDIAEQYNFKVPFSVEITPERDWKFFAEQAKKRGIEPSPLRA